MKIDLRTIPDAEVSGIDLMDVDITLPAPEAEPQRQYYFMALLKQQLVPERAKKNSKEFLTACITTFGCQMNARDSEKLEGILETVGYHIVETEDADFVVYNTCTVRENANLRVYGRLGQLGKYKKKNPGMIISLCGCMMQEPLVVEKLKKSYHFVNLIFGTHNIYRFAEYLVRCMTEDRMVIDIWKDTDKIVENLPVDRKYPFKSGVNIMFGCNNFCSYCIVPYVRGRERSRKPEEIVAEIKRLVADGVVEIMLLGQNVNSYRAGDVDFPELMRRVASISPLLRVRFATSHPKDMSDRLLEVMASMPNICRAIHLPAQSGATSMLERMNRKYTREWYLGRIAAIRRYLPDCAITTDLIAGFSGETEQEHLETLSLMREVGYEFAYMFKYSERPGTFASKHLPDDVPDEVKSRRLSEIIALQNELGHASNLRDVGREFEVLVEGESKRNPDQLSGRTSQNKVVVFDRGTHRVGDYVRVRITGCTPATLRKSARRSRSSSFWYNKLKARRRELCDSTNSIWRMRSSTDSKT